MAAVTIAMQTWIGFIDLHRKPEASGGYFLGRDLTFNGAKHSIRVGAGFYTDGVTIPRPLRWWADPYSGGYLAAAIIHDGLYAAQRLPRRDADAIFLEAMLSCDVRPSKAWTMWAGVRLFGGCAWRHNRERRQHMRTYVHVTRQPRDGHAAQALR